MRTIYILLSALSLVVALLVYGITSRTLSTDVLQILYLILAFGLVGFVIYAGRRGWLGDLARRVSGEGDREESLRQAKLLLIAAFGIIVMNITLAVTWGYFAQENKLTGIVFAVALVSLILVKIVSAPAAVNSWRAQSWAVFGITAVLTLGSTLFLLGASVGELLNRSGDEIQNRIESSKPAEALDAQIAHARERLAALAPYANPEQADAETAALDKRETDRQASIQQIENAIRAKLGSVPNNANGRSAGRTLDALTSGCSKRDSFYAQYCAEVSDLRGQLAGLRGENAPGSGTYASRYQEYTGLQAHLSDLLDQRAKLTESGQGVKTAYRPEDRFLAKHFKTDPETASWWKWLAISAVLEVFDILCRLVAQMLKNSVGGDPRRELRRKIDALMTLGIDPMRNLHEALSGVSFNYSGQQHGAPGFVAGYQVPAYTYHGPQDSPPQNTESRRFGFGFIPSVSKTDNRSDNQRTVVPNGTGQVDSYGQAVPNGTGVVPNGTGRAPNGEANETCTKDAILMAFMSGELPPDAGRNKVRAYLSGRGYTCGNSKLAELMKAAKAEFSRGDRT